ncbi:hypothetical protein GCM10023063_14890 [Arthrobacter methylotrophus]|uniref:Uncharacterized protein n=1 Tax=Arthrobacter methylotrophus TaxID=121291 RepID=A0ABV5UN19_9MICC
MTDTIARQPQGIPAGGQFAPTFHSEPAIGLPGNTSPAVPVEFKGSIDLKESEFGRLPELPASVGTPEVTFGFDIDGNLETRVTVDGSTMAFLNDPMADEITNTIESGHSGEDEIAPWSTIASYDDFEKTRTWAESVHERIDGATFGVLADATASTETNKAIIAFATGHGAPAAKLTPQQESAKRAAAVMAVCEEGQGADITMRDLFTDLRHYADAHSIDIYQAMDASLKVYQHEKTDQAFKEGY